jgi:hypothetical protein
MLARCTRIGARSFGTFSQQLQAESAESTSRCARRSGGVKRCSSHRFLTGGACPCFIRMKNEQSVHSSIVYFSERSKLYAVVRPPSSYKGIRRDDGP